MGWDYVRQEKCEKCRAYFSPTETTCSRCGGPVFAVNWRDRKRLWEGKSEAESDVDVAKVWFWGFSFVLAVVALVFIDSLGTNPVQAGVFGIFLGSSIWLERKIIVYRRGSRERLARIKEWLGFSYESEPLPFDERIELALHSRLAEAKRDTDFSASLPAIPEEDRDRHVWIIGMSRYGKSCTMHALACDDIGNNIGFTVIDPAGDLVGPTQPNSLLHQIPEKRAKDTIYLDLKSPVPLDFLGQSDEDEKTLLVGDIMLTFSRLQELTNGQWGTQFSAILRNVLYTLFDVQGRVSPDVTFLDIHYFLTDEDRQRQILGRLTDPVLINAWKKMPSQKDIEPILNRMNPIVMNKDLRTVFGEPRPRLNIYEAMEENKIILVNLAGPPETSILYGSLLVSKIQQAAFRRGSQLLQNRKPHHLYIDEFHNFRTSAFNTIISQGAKFKLCLTLANQWVDQLGELIPAMDAISTQLLFRLSYQDAMHFKGNIHLRGKDGVWDKDGTKLLSLRDVPFDASRLTDLPKFHALYRPADGKPAFVRTPKYAAVPSVSCAESIRERTLERYGCQAPPRSHNAEEPREVPVAEVIPPDKNKAPRPATPRGVFRPHARPVRPAVEKPDPE